MLRRSLLLAARASCSQQPGFLQAAQPALFLQAGGPWQRHGSRPYSQPAQDGDQQEESETYSDKVHQLASDIMGLTVLECSQLSKLLRDKLGVPRSAGMPMMAPMVGMAAAPGGGAAAGGEAEAPKEEKKEKTEFDVKLESFTPEGKIKVIKEIRAITSLGLKEAKELVEKAPVVVKSGVSKADAEAMQKQLEAVGGKVVME